MKTKKSIQFLATFLLMVFFSVGIVLGEDEKNSNLQSASSEGKQILSDLGSALKSIGSSIGEEVEKGASKARVKLSEKLLGTWIFSNGNSSTIIVCNKDESMTITQKSFLRKKEWTGSYNALGGTITFIIEGSENSGETWDLEYKIEDENRMQITSDSIPNDYNDYDFSNTAIFIKQD